MGTLSVGRMKRYYAYFIIMKKKFAKMRKDVAWHWERLTRLRLLRSIEKYYR
jgi:hypothetical protein